MTSDLETRTTGRIPFDTVTDEIYGPGATAWVVIILVALLIVTVSYFAMRRKRTSR